MISYDFCTCNHMPDVYEGKSSSSWVRCANWNDRVKIISRTSTLKHQWVLSLSVFQSSVA